MEYQHLTQEDKLAAISQVRLMIPTPEQVIKEAEKNHWISVIEATIGLHDFPDPFVEPDVSSFSDKHALLDQMEATLWQQ
jgi:hypothetical protein